ncbi:1663_t:CDS:2 [Funneliformis caledonium]|uniref:1663_t:CDS:1 n=1 Tax=Funneliformis caledonium TaxID=1117310 RepID=A0A9N9E3L9_9GLOM|nr:1663_t:CDS:2 [Funneliformis caledonium]
MAESTNRKITSVAAGATALATAGVALDSQLRTHEAFAAGGAFVDNEASNAENGASTETTTSIELSKTTAYEPNITPVTPRAVTKDTQPSQD